MSTDPEYLVVDRFEATIAVLMSDDTDVVEVDRSLLPNGARPGAVLRVTRDIDDAILWNEASVDEQATADRLAQAEDLVEELRSRDPGGDIVV